MAFMKAFSAAFQPAFSQGFQTGSQVGLELLREKRQTKAQKDREERAEKAREIERLHKGFDNVHYLSDLTGLEGQVAQLPEEQQKIFAPRLGSFDRKALPTRSAEAENRAQQADLNKIAFDTAKAKQQFDKEADTTNIQNSVELRNMIDAGESTFLLGDPADTQAYLDKVEGMVFGGGTTGPLRDRLISEFNGFSAQANATTISAKRRSLIDKSEAARLQGFYDEARSYALESGDQKFIDKTLPIIDQLSFEALEHQLNSSEYTLGQRWGLLRKMEGISGKEEATATAFKTMEAAQALELGTFITEQAQAQLYEDLRGGETEKEAYASFIQTIDVLGQAQEFVRLRQTAITISTQASTPEQLAIRIKHAFDNPEDQQRASEIAIGLNSALGEAPVAAGLLTEPNVKKLREESDVRKQSELGVAGGLGRTDIDPLTEEAGRSGSDVLGSLFPNITPPAGVQTVESQSSVASLDPLASSTGLSASPPVHQPTQQDITDRKRENELAAAAQGTISTRATPPFATTRSLRPPPPVASPSEESSVGIAPDEELAIRGNRPQRNLNPGNLKKGGIADRFASIDNDGDPRVDEEGHLIFSSAADGAAALRADISAKLEGKTSTGLGPDSTFVEFGSKYAEDPKWGSRVAEILGVDKDTAVTTVSIEEFLEAIKQQEGWFVPLPRVGRGRF